MSDIKEMFIEKLKITTWMDEDVVDLAIEKVHKIVQKIGYPTKVSHVRDNFFRGMLTVFRALTLWIHQALGITISGSR